MDLLDSRESPSHLPSENFVANRAFKIAPALDYVQSLQRCSGTVSANLHSSDSERNPRNPSRPPKRVVWGPDSTDEMAGLHIQVIPARPEEAGELGQALWGKLMRLVGGSFHRRGTEARRD